MLEGAPRSQPKQEKVPDIIPEFELTDDEAIKGIDFILDQHEELRDSWEKKIEDLPLQEQLVKLEEMAGKRRELLAPKVYVSSKLEVLPDGDPFTEKLFDDVIEMVKKQSEEVGRGFNGRVVEYRGDNKLKESDIVYKVLTRAPTAQQNDLLSEASYLADLHALAQDFTDGGVGVPKPFYCATLSNARLIAMQKVPGLSIEKIIEGNADLPVDFDLEKLEVKLLEFIKYVNNAGFYHNDIRPGNIMVDLERADPSGPEAYIIDTGSSKYEYAKQENIDNPKDRVMLKQVFQSLENYRARQSGKQTV
jgi:serine/threonine protein kinase